MDIATATAPFVSYAQNAEDFVLWRALSDIGHGCYIDVGANDPERDSVTCAFYERGWSGINVEPVAAYFERLREARPRDVNLWVVATATAGDFEFFEIAETGLSTLDADVAARHRAGGFAVSPATVPGRPLREIWSVHVHGPVHFLKIDVEGAEAHVLAGADFVRQRPWIIVVEATAPLTRIARHENWEPTLLASGYQLAHDDGVNRFYVAQEHADRGARLVAAGSLATGEYVRAAERIAQRDDLPPESHFAAPAAGFLRPSDPPPSLARPTSQLCTEAQFREPDYARRCREIMETPVFHRKQWEFVYVLQVLERAGMLQPSRRGLGFGCGREPLPAVMAARGCEVVATDLAAEAAVAGGWTASAQHAAQLDDLNTRGICGEDTFRKRVTFRPQDMNRISPDLTGFDFTWSSCAFEHLGSIANGIAFVANAMRALKPGGLAVHTTEFNLSSNLSTVESRDLVIFRKHDIEHLVRRLEQAGHRVWPLNLNPGAGPLDRYVDLPPYRHEPHLRLKLDRYVITSIGLIVQRGA